MKNAFLVFAPLLLPLISQAATLQAGTSAGDSASVVASCLAGAYPYGSDVRGCTYDTTPVTTVTPQYSESWAVYPTGFSAKAAASASLGTLRAFTEASIPSADSTFHNLQSHAYADMQDTLLASSSLGSLYNNYNYTVNITGFVTPSNATYAIPSIKSDAYVQLNIDVAATGAVLASQHWETSDLVLGGGVISGSILGVAANTLLSFDLFIQTEAGVGTSSAGQSGYAEADYQSTVHFYLDAATPGANTIGTSGYDYATPVPELPVWALMLGGGVVLAMQRRSAKLIK